MLIPTVQRSNSIRRSMLFIESLEDRKLLAGVTLDSTFGPDGATAVPDLRADATPVESALQTNGKIVVVGSRRARNIGSDTDIAVWRFNADGSADTSFGNNGVATLNLADRESATAVAIDANGKILVGGHQNRDWYVARFNSDGTLDQSFGINGIALRNGTIEDDSVTDIQIRDDGKIGVAGSRGRQAHFLLINASGSAVGIDRLTNFGFDATVYSPKIAFTDDNKLIGTANVALNSDDNDFIVVARFSINNFDLSVDSTFGGGGFSEVHAPNGFSAAQAVGLQSSGKIVVGGTSLGKLMLARLNENGGVDTSFGTNGIIITEPTPNATGFRNDLAILPDDRIVTVGYFDGDFITHRYLEDGELDDSFSSDGQIKTDFQDRSDVATSVAIREDGRALVVGEVFTAFGFNAIGMIQFQTSGQRDASFGDDGKIIHAFGFRQDVNTIARQADGKILVGGQYSDGLKSSFLISRYTSNGAIDTSFGDEGLVIVNFPGGIDNYVTDIVVGSNGRIYAGGFGGQNFAVVALNPNGSRVTSFGTNGRAIHNLGGNDRIHQMALQDDGKLVAIGRSASGAVLARYNTDGSLDSSFSGDGIARPVSSGTYTEIALNGAGKIIVGGSTPHSDGRRFAIFRLNKNGTLDTSFGGGLVSTPMTGDGDAVITDIAVDGDGNVFATGTMEDNQFDLPILKLLSNGTPDSSFGDGGKAIHSYGFVAISKPEELSLGSNGSVLVGGLASFQNWQLFVAKVRADGTKDPNFALDGLATTDYPQDGFVPIRELKDMLLFPNGSFFAAGHNNDGFPFGDHVVKASGVTSDVPFALSEDGVLTIRGTSRGERIEAFLDEDFFGRDLIVAVMDATRATFQARHVSSIEIHGLGGNDHIEVAETLTLPTQLFGGAGDDSMFGGSGRDIMDGGTGADLFRGRGGKDTADYSSRTANITIGIGTFADDGEAGEKDNVFNDIERVIGGSGNDQIKGGANNNELYGGAGNDTLIGLGGRDALFGQGGADLLRGNDGVQDYLDGGSGTDTGEKDSFDTWFSVEQFI